MEFECFGCTQLVVPNLSTARTKVSLSLSLSFEEAPEVAVLFPQARLCPGHWRSCPSAMRRCYLLKRPHCWCISRNTVRQMIVLCCNTCCAGNKHYLFVLQEGLESVLLLHFGRRTSNWQHSSFLACDSWFEQHQDGRQSQSRQVCMGFMRPR